MIEEEDEDEVLENENNVNGSDVNASGSIQRVIRRVDSSSNQGFTNSEGSEDEDTVKSTARQSQLSGYKLRAFSMSIFHTALYLRCIAEGRFIWSHCVQQLQ